MGSGKPKPAKERLLTIDFLFFQQCPPRSFLLMWEGGEKESVSLPACPLPHFFLPHLKKDSRHAPPSFWAQESAELDVTRRKVLEKKGSWKEKTKETKKFDNNLISFMWQPLLKKIHFKSTP